MFITIVSYIIHKPYLIHLNNAIGIILCTCDITQDLMTRVPLGLGALEFSTLLLSCVRCCVWNFDSTQNFEVFCSQCFCLLFYFVKLPFFYTQCYNLDFCK